MNALSKSALVHARRFNILLTLARALSAEGEYARYLGGFDKSQTRRDLKRMIEQGYVAYSDERYRVTVKGKRYVAPFMQNN